MYTRDKVCFSLNIHELHLCSSALSSHLQNNYKVYSGKEARYFETNGTQIASFIILHLGLLSCCARVPDVIIGWAIKVSDILLLRNTKKDFFVCDHAITTKISDLFFFDIFLPRSLAQTLDRVRCWAKSLKTFQNVEFLSIESTVYLERAVKHM